MNDDLAYQHNRRQHIIRFMALFMSIIMTAPVSLMESIFVREPYHMSILTGEGWVMELLAGHPKRILSQLGVRHLGNTRGTGKTTVSQSRVTRVRVRSWHLIPLARPRTRPAVSQFLAGFVTVTLVLCF